MVWRNLVEKISRSLSHSSSRDFEMNEKKTAANTVNKQTMDKNSNIVRRRHFVETMRFNFFWSSTFEMRVQIWVFSCNMTNDACLQLSSFTDEQRETYVRSVRTYNILEQMKLQKVLGIYISPDFSNGHWTYTNTINGSVQRSSYNADWIVQGFVRIGESVLWLWEADERKNRILLMLIDVRFSASGPIVSYVVPRAYYEIMQVHC